MSELAVRVEGICKQYRLGGPRERYSTLRDQLDKLASAPLRALRGRGERSDQDGLFWALKDVSFEVKRGEAVGIIGRNGAGKSTLLKILSQITEPTEGEVDVHGRVGSLLEVGTGFHPELTGRENVYLNGAILGMRRTEIARKFDEIVAFAEVEKFIDTPVKHYSSGMYMRLAFAVAAHLDPEILVVDEVLAVGDAEFQKKCLGQMGEVAQEGRTVLFVSHNMSAVQALCPTAILLDAGRVDRVGPTGSVVPEYLARVGKTRRESAGPRRLGPELELTDIRFTPAVFPAGGRTAVSVTLSASEALSVDHLCILIYSLTGIRVAVADLRSPDAPYRVRASNRLTVKADLRRVNLVEGEYTVGLYLAAGSWHGDVYDLTSFEVTASPEPSRVTPYHPMNRGFVELDHGPIRATAISFLEAIA